MFDIIKQVKEMKIYKDKIDEKILRSVCSEVKTPVSEEDYKLSLDMIDYLKKSQDSDYAEKNNIRAGIGLSANQIGVLKRIIVIYLPMDE